jgi:hypothetical protein
MGSLGRVRWFTTWSRNSPLKEHLGGNVLLMTRSWNGGTEVAETSVKRLLCYGFRRTSNAMGQVHQYYRRICREIHIYSRFYHIFTFYIHLWHIYWLCLVFAIIKFSCTKVFCVKSTCNARQLAGVNIFLFVCNNKTQSRTLLTAALMKLVMTVVSSYT